MTQNPKDYEFCIKEVLDNAKKRIKILDDSDKKSCEQVFDGLISTPGKKLAVSTSEDDAILQVDVKGEKTQVFVWVDDSDFPGLVLIETQ